MIGPDHAQPEDGRRAFFNRRRLTLPLRFHGLVIGLEVKATAQHEVCVQLLGTRLPDQCLIAGLLSQHKPGLRVPGTVAEIDAARPGEADVDACS